MIHHLHQLTSADYMVCMLPKHRNICEGEPCEGICHYKGGGLSRELPHTRKLHRELPREHANHMISGELVHAIELWPNEPCTPQLMVEAIVKDHGISDQTSPQNKQQGYNPEEESHKPRGLIHENCACKHIGIHENQDVECKTCMFSMKSLENLANAVKSMVFLWKTWKSMHFQCFF